jgi:hypothetical protein
MSVNAELALAAARVRLLSEQLPEELRPDVASDWAELLDEVHRARSAGAATLAILEWRRHYEARLTTTLIHAPVR